MSNPGSNIPFIDLQRQQEHVGNDIRQRIDAVLRHGMFIMGPEVRELEERCAEYCGTRYAVSCGSGTDALMLPLMAWGVGPGDAVFVPTFTFIATAGVVALLGATPVFVDIDRATFNMDAESLENAIAQVQSEANLTPKCVIPVDLFGLPARYDELVPIAKRHGLKVLEDAAQSFGARSGNKVAGSIGDAAGVSFFPAKPVGAYGDAGIVLTDNEALAERLRSIRVHGQGIDKYHNARIGMNARMDTLQAAVLLAKLQAFPDELTNRQIAADSYTEALRSLVTTPFIPEGMMSAWAQYSVLVPDRDGLQKHLGNQGIPTMIYYPIPLHLQEAFADLGYALGDYPVAEAIADEIVSLPMHGYLTDEVTTRIIEGVTEYLGT